MKILVSACLLGENCKYSGGNNYSRAVAEFVQGHTVIPVCPEVLVGLPVPRSPAEIVRGEVMTADGRSVDREYRLGAQLALEAAADADLAILQPRSPSCGCTQVYDGTFSRRLISGKGIFAQLLADRGIPAVDADRLNEIVEG